MASRWEVLSLVAIGLAILFGGVSLLLTIAHAGAYAVAALAVLAFFQIATLRRNVVAATPAARLLVTRDITFLVAIGCAIAFVIHPARWADGAAIAAVEFGIVLEVLARASPVPAEQSSPPPPPNPAA